MKITLQSNISTVKNRLRSSSFVCRKALRSAQASSNTYNQTPIMPQRIPEFNDLVIYTISEANLRKVLGVNEFQSA